MAICDDSDDVIVGNWRKECSLGQGASGKIVRWRNMVTREEIAVKDCIRAASELTTRSYERWKREVDILQKLQHPNLVRSFPIPEELCMGQSALPSIAMEYCNGGDLRKVLSRPENCRGLTEQEVRCILSDVSSGLAYLHEHRIIHRDLKPENIVLHEQAGVVIYKLIDLGFAKELDHSSLCCSFVGTLQYLAPELFEQRPYTKAVDYWSLGVLAYEVATGRRPFFSGESPATWIPLVSKKSSSHIAADFNDDGIPVYSSKLPSSHHLTRAFREGLELWLQVLLERDPEKRGHRDGQSVHEMLKRLVSQQVAHVFNVTDLSLISLSRESAPSLSELTATVCSAAGLAPESGLLLTDKEVVPSEDFWESNLLSVATAVYLFDLSTSKETCKRYRAEALLDVVDKVLQWEHCDLRRDVCKKLKELWKEGIFCVQQELGRCRRMLSAYRALLAYSRSQFSKLHEEMQMYRREVLNLESKMKFAQECYTMDVESLQKLKERGISLDCDKLLNDWACCDQLLTPVYNEGKAAKELHSHVSQLHVQTAEHGRTPFARFKQPDVLEKKLKHILELYTNAKRNCKEAQYFLPTCRILQSELVEFTQDEARLVEECQTSVRDMCHLLGEIRSARDRSRASVATVRTLSWEVSMQQRRRQEAIWSLCKVQNEHSRVSKTRARKQTSPSSVSSANTGTSLPETVKQNIRESSRVREEIAILHRDMSTALTKAAEMFQLPVSGAETAANSGVEKALP